MSKFVILLIAQFLSAFADNAILFTVIALVMQSQNMASWYVPALQSSFLISFVILAPWVGTLADHYPKTRILVAANLLKACGGMLLLFHIEPLMAYAIVGSGAAIYSPAKYGILPELVSHHELVKANSWIEGSTILAILLGMVIGAKVADASISLALLGTISLFILSATMASLLGLRKSPSDTSINNNKHGSWQVFFKQMPLFFAVPQTQRVILGCSLFWASAATLRVILVAWSPLVLMLTSASEIAQLTLFLAIGIIIGSMIVPYLITLDSLQYTRYAAYSMGLLIIALSFTTSLGMSECILLLVGMAGGIFIVPNNATLQTLGQQTIGSGRAIALQGFFQNLAMLLAVGSYSLAASQQVPPIEAMFSLGVLLFIALWITFKFVR